LGVIARSEATKQSILSSRRHGLLRFARNDGQTHNRDLAACFSPESFNFVAPLLNRGRRECRVRAAPAVSCAKSCAFRRTRAYRAAEAVRHPLRNGFTAYFVLSPVSEFVLSPSSAGHFPLTWHQQRVSGPHNLAVRLGVFVQRANARLTPKRPPHPWPNASLAQRIVTIAKRPSCGQGRREKCH
jgi:hypothetical protein